MFNVFFQISMRHALEDMHRNMFSEIFIRYLFDNMPRKRTHKNKSSSQKASFLLISFSIRSDG